MDCEVSEEAVPCRRLVDPKRPSQEEIDEHYKTHLPFRNWCPHCMRGKAKALGCKKSDKVAGDLEEFHLDYCFPDYGRAAVGDHRGGEGESHEDDPGDGRTHDRCVQLNPRYVVYLRF